MILTREQAAAFEEAADDAGIRVYWGYSGRGMYGKTCAGVVTDAIGFAGFLVAVSQADSALAAVLHKRLRTDGMGLQYIFYFPGVHEPEGWQE